MKKLTILLVVSVFALSACKEKAPEVKPKPPKKSDVGGDVKVLKSTQEFKDEMEKNIGKGIKRIEDRTK